MTTFLSIFLLFKMLVLPLQAPFPTDIDFEDLFNNHQMIILIIEPESGQIEYANQAAVDFYGYSISTLTDMTIQDINTLTPEQVALERAKALEEQRNFFIFRHQIASGEIKTVYVYSYPVEIEGQDYLFSVIVDQTAYITAQNRNTVLLILLFGFLLASMITTSYLLYKASQRKKELEGAVKDSQEQERMKATLIANLPGAVYRCKNDDDFTMIYVSKQMEELTGYKDKEFYRHQISYSQLIHPSDREWIQEKFKKVVLPGESVEIVYRIITKDMQVKWVEERARLLDKRDEDGYAFIEGFIQDISVQKAAEEEVKYRENLMNYIIQNSNRGVAVHDKDLNYIYVSEKYKEMYRVGDQNIIGKHHYEVFPDLPQKWRDVHQRVLQGEICKGDKDEFIRADGSIDYTRWLCLPWYDKTGQIGGLIIYTEVINDLIETERELARTVEQLQLVMDNLPIGIAVNSVDPGVVFNYMNEKFPKIYLTTKEELAIADSFWDAVYEDPIYRKEIKERVLSDIASNDPNRMKWEGVPITRDGKVIKYVNAYNTSIPNSNLQISTVMDVTEQKQKENEMRHMGLHDGLTGLPNRRYLEQMLKEIDQEKNYPLVIAILDFDGLKILNDAYGHEEGDQVLINIAKHLNQYKRPLDFVARSGGDEFVVICPNTTSEEFEVLRNRFLGIINPDQQEHHYSISIGHSVKEKKETSIQEVLKQAENEMFSNKILKGQSARNETIMTLFNALQEKYFEEKVHSDRVSRYCRLMGEAMNFSPDRIKELEFAGLMHDIGKITMPDNILDKPGKLNQDEWEIMQRHTINGYQILRSADKYSRLAEYALTHHERIDGKGYPNGLKGEEIPLFSRIICIVDAYEAMTSNRPYRKAMDSHKAMEQLTEHSGTQFDAELVQIFIHKVIPKS